MSAIVYPVGLPEVRENGISSQYQNAVIRTQMDAGPAKQRLRYTSVPKNFNASIVVDDAQYAIFDAWYTDVLGYGTLRFLMNDPRTGELREFRFTDVPGESDENGLTAITLPLERMQ